jgi:hypothetical protein
VSGTTDLIMSMTEQELRAALLILASPSQGLGTAEATAEVTADVVARTRGIHPAAGPPGASALTIATNR